MKTNHIFLRHFSTGMLTPNGQVSHEPGLPPAESIQTYEYYKGIKDYDCPINPSWEPDVEIEISVTPKISYLLSDMVEVLKGDDYLNIVYVPMNYPTWRWFDTQYPHIMHDLEVLADPLQPWKIAVVFDYNNETILPGNFANNEGQLECLKDKDFSEFYCSTMAWDRENVLDTIGFRAIISNLCVLGTYFFRCIKEDPSLKMRKIYTDVDNNYPIRYFCPNNVFRANRAMAMVKMHKKQMLEGTEWNMNKFSQWYEMDQFHDHNPFKHYADEYFKLFGTNQRSMSYPWNLTYNSDRQLEDKDIYSREPSRCYDCFDKSLMQKAYIYICNETFTDAPQEPAINPTKPVRVGDFSEKIIKGFMYGKPMFINARQGTMKMVEDLGFDMFRDMNHIDYDTIEDDSARVDAMLECAKKFPDPTTVMVERMQKNTTLIYSKEFWWSTQKDFLQILLDNHS